MGKADSSSNGLMSMEHNESQYIIIKPQANTPMLETTVGKADRSSNGLMSMEHNVSKNIYIIIAISQYTNARHYGGRGRSF